ncbi:CocE/NonD family hydrolase [Streptomyces sp. NPDC020141]|uniref:CocE/NonD family hydrolase n=1 Tax=Streptomyces sp. NPDC020141 TaxID=3365065 RepID=UPI0037B8535B
MTAAGSEPTPSITDATLTDIAANGFWGAGLTVNPAAVDTGKALLAAARGEKAASLPAGLASLVADVRRGATIGVHSIPREEEVSLSAFSIQLNGPGPRPLVVVPAGWSPYGWLPFLYSYLVLAQRGYNVLAYTPRGLGAAGLVSTSKGFVDVAGRNDVEDGSAVIDWALEHIATADGSRIGLFGESYGSGISQLVAAHDSRVRAVVALSTWGSLATSLLGNETQHVAAVKALIAFTGGTLEEKFDEDNRRILTDFLNGRITSEVRRWAEDRSPESYLERTNDNGVRTFFSNTWHETLFPAGQTVEHFNRLTGPKRLNMWIGDHGAPEGPGLAGLPAGPTFPGLREPIQEAYAWLDHHLLGKDNDVATWPQVSNQVMFTYRTTPLPDGSDQIGAPARREERATWDDVTTSTERWYPGATGASGDGALTTTRPAAGWKRDFTAGALTAATAVDAILQTGQKEWYGNPKVYDQAKFERSRLLVWASEPLSGRDGVARAIRGTATAGLCVRNTGGDATVVAYLFDVAPDGTARIITHEPYTATDVEPGSDRYIEVRLQPAAYDLPTGHRLALVVNGRDELYSFAGAEASTTTISSSDERPVFLDLPLG